MHRPMWEKKAKTAWEFSMDCTEAYKEHIMYSFNDFCKVVIRYAAINAWRDRNRRRQREISFEYLTEEKFYPLSTSISDSIREGMTDIFGKGTELDDSEGVQTARKAKELLDKLAEYKPLAKIEELEECNYNMIDNVLNNEKPKEEKKTGRISIKEKLAEKKAVTRQRDKSEKEVSEKETEKNQRGRYKLWINLQWKKSI